MGSMLKGSTPAQPKPVRMPKPDDPDIVQAAALRRQEQDEKRRGRRSTDLSGGAYSKTTMG